MELAFEKTELPCLNRKLCDVQSQEQTLELRLPEGMPDIGSVLGAWGQCILRGKEWRSAEIGVSGGVMVWVLYQPAEGGSPQSLEAWMPMQQKWGITDCQREGVIRTRWQLKSLDARTLSVRKMMLRATVQVLAEVLEPSEAVLYHPTALPEDIQLLRREYPAQVPCEAGEKTFRVEDVLTLPAGVAFPEKLLYCQVTPILTEQKVAGGKAVVRGSIRFHMLYLGEDGTLCTADPELSFAQFEDLDRDYNDDALLSVMMDVTGFEPELQDGQFRVKCGLTAQYTVHDRVTACLVEDAYSPVRSVSVHTQDLELPNVLDISRKILEPEVEYSGGRIVDAVVYPEHPVARRAGDLTEMEFPGTVQILAYNDEGHLEGCQLRWNEHWELPVDRDAQIQPAVTVTAPPQIANGGRVLMQMDAQAVFGSPKLGNAVTAMEAGEKEQPDPNRPSLILRRAGDASLWEIAKKCGSTVEAIRVANCLDQEPMDDRMLLIPIS